MGEHNVSSGPVAPMVSVIVPTYQHSAYIEQCLDGILMQQTTFPVEILVGEDESDDGTREICQRYAEAHPQLIRLRLGSRKDVIRILGKPTGRYNALGLLKAARGRYIALCEGDDYWTDPLKLQKQVDFLERHPGYTMCFHHANLLKEGEIQLFPIPPEVDLSDVQYDDLLRTYNFITTASVLFRNVFKSVPDWFLKVPFLDMALYAVAASKGKVKCLEDNMAVWRFTGTGSWTGLELWEQNTRLLMSFDLLMPHLSRAQRGIVAGKRLEIIARIAEARYPARPRRRWVYQNYLMLPLWLRNFLKT